MSHPYLVWQTFQEARLHLQRLSNKTHLVWFLRIFGRGSKLKSVICRNADFIGGIPVLLMARQKIQRMFLANVSGVQLQEVRSRNSRKLLVVIGHWVEHLINNGSLDSWNILKQPCKHNNFEFFGPT